MSVSALARSSARSQGRRLCWRDIALTGIRYLESDGRPPSKAAKYAGLQRMDILGDGPQNTRRVTIDVNGLRISGAVFLFPHFATIWNVQKVEDICADAFVLPKLMLPRPDIVIIGMGRSAQPLSPELRRYFSDIGVSVDPMDTANACHTFNVLNQEGRNVSVAMLPVSVEYSNMR